MCSETFFTITVHDLTLPNLVVMTAMGTHFADEGSYITQKLTDFQAARAKAAWG